MSTSCRLAVRVLGFVFVLMGTSLLSAEEPTWRVGLARAKITPKGPMWMSGYAPRLASSVLHDIWTKVIAIEAPGGHRAVVVTADVCGFSKLSYEAIFAEVRKRCNLERSQFMLTCSHTHTGPALRECLQVCWPWSDPQARALVEEYSLGLERTIVEKVVEALERMTPATLWAVEGRADFAVNRRNNPEGEVPQIRQRGEPLKGPVDHSIPILAVRTPDGKLRAVLIGYACHTTTLASTEWSGDYAGFAMLVLERTNPEMQALFYQGCGADQNPLPRRSVELCRKYGEMLAAGVEAALRRPMRSLAPRLKTAFDFVDLPYDRNTTVAELQASARDGGVMGGLSQRYLDQLAAGKPLATSYPYPVQVWKLGSDQLWISLAGEVVVDYSLKFKAEYGAATWTSGFAQEMVCYIPSVRVLKEGFGQEVGALRSYGLSAHGWTAEVEDRVTAGVERLVEKVK